MRSINILFNILEVNSKLLELRIYNLVKPISFIDTAWCRQELSIFVRGNQISERAEFFIQLCWGGYLNSTHTHTTPERESRLKLSARIQKMGGGDKKK